MTKLNFKVNKYFKFTYNILILAGLCSCSTINQIDRTNKDVSLDKHNFVKINGIYSNKNLKSTWTLDGIIYQQKPFYKELDNDSIRVRIKAINDKKLEIDILQNGLCLKSVRLKGKYADGYFSVKPKFRFLTPFFPLLWGPGFFNLSLGITKNDNLVLLESHGGVVVITVAPVFASGAQSDHEFKRIE